MKFDEYIDKLRNDHKFWKQMEQLYIDSKSRPMFIREFKIRCLNRYFNYKLNKQLRHEMRFSLLLEQKTKYHERLMAESMVSFFLIESDIESFCKTLNKL